MKRDYGVVLAKLTDEIELLPRFEHAD